MTGDMAKKAEESDGGWAKRKIAETECSHKTVVQVRSDRVWVGTFFGPDDKTELIGTYETFPRPEGKTHRECVLRALAKASKWVPEDFTTARVVVSDW